MAADGDPEPWWHRSACLGMDIDLFYPFGPVQDVSLTLAVCRRCPVRVACLAVALNTGEPHGIWGGLTEEERRRLPRGGCGNIVAAFAQANLIVYGAERAASTPACKDMDARPGQ